MITWNGNPQRELTTNPLSGKLGADHEYLLVPRRVHARVPTPRTASYGHHVACRPQGNVTSPGCGGPSGVVMIWPTVRSAPWIVDGVCLRGARAFAADLPRPIYRITCPSRIGLDARSQVLVDDFGVRGGGRDIVADHKVTFPIVCFLGPGVAGEDAQDLAGSLEPVLYVLFGLFQGAAQGVADGG